MIYFLQTNAREGREYLPVQVKYEITILENLRNFHLKFPEIVREP